MRDQRKEVSSSDDSESVDDPDPVPIVENTHLDKSFLGKNLNNSSEENNFQDDEAVSSDSRNNLLNLGKNSTDKSARKKQRSSEVSVAAKKKNLGNETAVVQATFNSEDLSSDDEVYIFHCPLNFKKHELLNKIIDISKPRQFVYIKESENYQLEILNSKKKQITLAVPEKSSGGRLFNLPLRGHMILQKIVEMENNAVTDFNEIQDRVIFPNDIKIRHPFLGVNWKSYIDSTREAIEKNQFIKKTRKKHKKEKFEESASEENIKVKRKSDSENPFPKKHKKKA